MAGLGLVGCGWWWDKPLVGHWNTEQQYAIYRYLKGDQVRVASVVGTHADSKKSVLYVYMYIYVRER